MSIYNSGKITIPSGQMNKSAHERFEAVIRERGWEMVGGGYYAKPGYEFRYSFIEVLEIEFLGVKEHGQKPTEERIAFRLGSVYISYPVSSKTDKIVAGALRVLSKMGVVSQ